MNDDLIEILRHSSRHRLIRSDQIASRTSRLDERLADSHLHSLFPRRLFLSSIHQQCIPSADPDLSTNHHGQHHDFTNDLHASDNHPTDSSRLVGEIRSDQKNYELSSCSASTLVDNTRAFPPGTNKFE